jgi:hypothetical protein
MREGIGFEGRRLFTQEIEDGGELQINVPLDGEPSLEMPSLEYPHMRH